MRAVATLVPGLHGHPLAAAGDQFAVVPDLGREVAVGPAVQLTGAVAEHALQAGIGLQDDAPGRKAADTDRRALEDAEHVGRTGRPAGPGPRQAAHLVEPVRTGDAGLLARRQLFG